MSWRFYSIAAFILFQVPLAFSQNQNPPPAQEKAPSRSERMVEICSRRLDAEMAKVDPQPEAIVSCMYRLRKFDHKKYTNYLSELDDVYRRLTYFNKDKRATDEAFFNFIKAFTEKVSVKDGLELALRTVSDPKRVPELAAQAIVQMEPQSYIDFYNQNEKKILSIGIGNLQEVLEWYCLSTVIQGTPADCVSKLSRYIKSSPAPWLKVSLAMGYSEQGKTKEAEESLLSVSSSKTTGKECPEFDRSLLWAPFVAGQVYRVEKKFDLSKACFKSFYDNSEEGGLERFLHSLEMGKTERFENLESSDQYFSRAVSYVPRGYDEFFRMILDIEILKNLAIREDREGFSKLKAKIDNRLKPTNLTKYKVIVAKIDKYLLNNASQAVPGSDFESLELRNLVEAKSRIKPKVPPKAKADKEKEKK